MGAVGIPGPWTFHHTLDSLRIFLSGLFQYNIAIGNSLVSHRTIIYADAIIIL